MNNDGPPEHGGDLARAIARYGIEAQAWLDLSAAINPEPYPIAALADDIFQRLPEDDGALLRAAAAYYFSRPGAQAALVAAPGSQALIQWLPLLRARCRVAVPAIGYREHAFRWRWAGHELIEYDPRARDAIDGVLSRSIDVLVVINPNNPLADRCDATRLLGWLRTLQRRGGWLVVDEAFADAEPAHSMAAHVGEPGLIVLRSLGKFFGLAGVRCGFALCAREFARPLQTALGPWPLSGPAAALARRALLDAAWQRDARSRLQMHSRACAELLAQVFGADRVRHTALFASVELPAATAANVQDWLARDGIWVRLVGLDADTALLRFGLAAVATPSWRRLQSALRGVAAFLDAGHAARL